MPMAERHLLHGSVGHAARIGDKRNRVATTGRVRTAHKHAHDRDRA